MLDLLCITNYLIQLCFLCVPLAKLLCITDLYKCSTVFDSLATKLKGSKEGGHGSVGLWGSGG